MDPLAEAAFPSFRRHARSLDLPAGAPGGIAIACPPRIYTATSSVLPLYGTLRVARAEAEGFCGHLLRAVTVLLRGPFPATVNVGDGQLLFDEDLADEGELKRAYFNLDLFSSFNLLRVPNRYWVSASIFQHVSNIVSVEVLPGRDPGSGTRMPETAGRKCDRAK